MWDLRNRSVVVSISVLSGCIFFYNTWGPILAVTTSLFLVVYACFSLITNDSLLSLHAFLLFNYLKEAAVELGAILDSTVIYISKHVVTVWNTVKRFYRERFFLKMERRRKSKYQLSSESTPNVRNSRFSLLSHLSPIPHGTPKHISDIHGNAEYEFHHNTERQFYNQNNVFNSTTTHQYKTEDLQSPDTKMFKSNLVSQRKTSPMYNQNHTLSRGENTTYFSPDGSPWGTSISPKMRSKAGGIKTVQTVAGPLLASTRYNIDPKIYADVTSPGLTTRLTKYATEANTKLTHQSQYGIGQFPKVNLHASQVPLITVRSPKMRMPVTVRIAPPETTKYSPPERQQILSNLHHIGNKITPSVVQVLREISLKRHASREDVTSDSVKKQRTESKYSDDLKQFEEVKQKRSRDDSSKSEDEISPQSKIGRPTKRSKTPSCYGILHLLSSNIHVAPGVKRKAVDFSHSETPAFEKHFKSLENIQNESLQTYTQYQDTDTKANKEDKSEKSLITCDIDRDNKLQDHIPTEILKNSKENLIIHNTSVTHATTKNVQIQTSDISTKLTDKLFMRAEPQRNEKLRSLVEEQENIKAKFTTDDVEEITKEDIMNMRQTSMRARLQSMFDAISGKAASRINPDVVIQAEEVNAVTSLASSSADCATLNSLTTTTNVNTTPISTSAIAPSLPSLEPNTRPTKHITFNVPDTTNILPSMKSNINKIFNEENVSLEKKETLHNKLEITSSSEVNISLSNAVSVTTNSIQVRSTVPIAKSLPNLITTCSSSDNFATNSTTAMTISPVTSTSLCGNTDTNVIPVSTTVSSNCDTDEGKKNFVHYFKSDINSTEAKTNINPSLTFTFGSTTNCNTSRNKTLVPNVSAKDAVISEQKSGSQTTDGKLLTTIANTIVTSTFKSMENCVPNSIFKNSTVAPVTSTPQFVFGPNNVNVQVTKSETFSFSTSQNTFTSPTITQANPNFNNVSSNANNSLSNLTATTFNGNAHNTSVFGLSTTTSGFSFGTQNVSMVTSRPIFSFGTNTTVATSTLTTPSTVVASSSTINSNATPTFGKSITTASQLNTPSTLIFGSGSTTSIFGTKSNQVFGELTPSTVTSTLSLQKTTAAPIFGSSTITSSQAMTATSALFPSSSVHANTNVSTTITTPIFNSNNNIFGQAKPPTAFDTKAFDTKAVTFGGGNIPLFQSQTTTAPTFNTINVTTNTLAFGTTNTVSSTFGTQNVRAPVATQHSTMPAFDTSTSMFGTENNSTPIFGVTTSASGGDFNSTMTSGFVGQNTSNLSFGAPNNTNTFGDNKPSLFGVQTTSRSAFETNESNNTNNIFTFGGNQRSQQNPLKFSFNSNTTSTNNTMTTGSTPFQFGATSSKPAGFNFSAPSTTPSNNFGATTTSSFNATSSGMFSIGSGSTAPRLKGGRTKRTK